MQQLFNDASYSVATVKSSSIGALFSFQEYLANAIDKARTFLRDDISNTAVTTITKAVDDTKQVVLSLTKQQYQNALNDADGTQELADSAGNLVEISNEEILDAYQEAISELCVQKEYVGCCLTGLTFSATDLVTRVKGIFPGVAGYIIEKYTRLVDSSSLLSSLENFFQLSKFAEPSNEDGYLVIKTKQGYTGVSVWEVAIKQLGEQLSSFFTDVVWKGITKIGEFFTAIWDGIKRLGIWLVSQIAKQYTTNYSKVSNACGIMDYPLIQVFLGHLVYPDDDKWTLDIDKDSSSWFKICQQAEAWILSNENYDLTQSQTLSWFKNRSHDYKDFGNFSALYPMNQNHGVLCTIISQVYGKLGLIIERSLLYTDEDGHKHIRTLDVTIPVVDLKHISLDRRNIYQSNQDYNRPSFLLRLGVDQGDNLYLQMFMINTYDNISNERDADVAYLCQQSVAQLPDVLGDIYNILPNMSQSLNAANLFHDINGAGYEGMLFTSKLVPAALPDGPYDLVNNLRLVDAFTYCKDNIGLNGWMYDNEYGHTYRCGFKFSCFLTLLHAFMAYIVMNSDCRQWIGDQVSKSLYDSGWNGYIVSEVSNVHYSSRGDMATYSRAYFNNICGNDGLSSSSIPYWVDFDYTNQLMYFATVGKDLFVPYNKVSTIPVSIHYQNLDERASEITKGIWTILIMVAVVIVAVKVIKFTKNRKTQTYLAQAAMDKLSWDVVSNSSPENVMKFNKARKKFKRMNLMNNILGLSSSAAIEASSSSTDAIISTIRGLKSADDESSGNQVTLNSIYKTIKG